VTEPTPPSTERVADAEGGPDDPAGPIATQVSHAASTMLDLATVRRDVGPRVAEAVELLTGLIVELGLGARLPTERVLNAAYPYVSRTSFGRARRYLRELGLLTETGSAWRVASLPAAGPEPGGRDDPFAAAVARLITADPRATKIAQATVMLVEVISALNEGDAVPSSSELGARRPDIGQDAFAQAKVLARRAGLLQGGGNGRGFRLAVAPAPQRPHTHQ
jgi:hypothetical protein